MGAPEYVLLEEQEPITERYPSSPPVSAVRAVLREHALTMRSSEWPTQRRWPVHFARLSACAVILVLAMDLPFMSVLLYLASTATLVFFARQS